MNDAKVYKQSPRGQSPAAGLMFAYSSMYMIYSSTVYWEYAVFTLQPLLNKKKKLEEICVVYFEEVRPYLKDIV